MSSALLIHETTEALDPKIKDMLGRVMADPENAPMATVEDTPVNQAWLRRQHFISHGFRFAEPSYLVGRALKIILEIEFNRLTEAEKLKARTLESVAEARATARVFWALHLATEDELEEVLETGDLPKGLHRLFATHGPEHADGRMTEYSTALVQYLYWTMKTFFAPDLGDGETPGAETEG